MGVGRGLPQSLWCHEAQASHNALIKNGKSDCPVIFSQHIVRQGPSQNSDVFSERYGFKVVAVSTEFEEDPTKVPTDTGISCIPGSRHNPKISGFDDAEVVCD